MLDLISFTIIITAIFSFLNTKYLKLVPGIGVMLIGILVSLSFIGLNYFEILPAYVSAGITDTMNSIDFNSLVLDGMLGILLFAAAIHVQFQDILNQKYIIALMASVGLVISVVITAIGVYFISMLLGIDLPFIYALLFGAIISPTDPIAVMAIFKSVGAPKSQETKLTGESLFNDGLAIVIFTIVLSAVTGSSEITFTDVYTLFIQEVFGGVILGMFFGYIAMKMISSIEEYDVEILITIALVFAVYIASHKLHVSNPIAAVVAGLLLGNHGKKLAMSKKTIEHLDNFWHLIDEILNATLFVLLGLKLMTMSFTMDSMFLSTFAIMIVLFARFVGIGLLITLLTPLRSFSSNTIKILTWAGLRGGISVALSLSLPESEYKEIILVMTYIVVVFSIIVQGLTLGSLVKKSNEGQSEEDNSVSK